ncbi:MAG: ester cyclase [Thermomicrobiales bacterium]
MLRRLATVATVAVALSSSAGLGGVPNDARAQDAATPMASPCAANDATANGALAERFMQAFETGDTDDLRTILAPDEVHHWGVGPDAIGAEAVAASISAYSASFGDLQLDIKDTISADDLVVVRWEMTGAQTGSYAGVGPSDRATTWSGINIFRIACGQIAESWNETDHLGRLRATGVITEAELNDVDDPDQATPAP